MNVQQLVTFIALFLQSLALAVLVGYSLLLALVYLPTFERELPGGAVGTLIVEVSARARPWLQAALLTFVASGFAPALAGVPSAGFGGAGPNLAITVIRQLLMIALVRFAGTIGAGPRSLFAEVARAGGFRFTPAPAEFTRLVAGGQAALGCGVLVFTVIGWA
jgi:hypothetical protein